MFVDASALIAILSEEAEADEFLAILQNSRESITSPIALFETALGVCRKRRTSVAVVSGVLREFLARARIDCVPLTSADADVALVAHETYGKGRGHPAQLNMGDCFAYAVAKNRAVPLLFKGDDFARTDIRRAAKAKR